MPELRFYGTNVLFVVTSLLLGPGDYYNQGPIPQQGHVQVQQVCTVKFLEPFIINPYSVSELEV